MPSYLIAGASRGLGYGFLQVLGSQPGNTVIGLVRNKPATEQQLAKDGLTNVHLVSADITDSVALKQAAEEVSKILGGGGLDVLINNGAYISETTAFSSLADGEEDATKIFEETQKSFDCNVYGVLKTVYAFLPLIRKGALKKVIAISSGMGDLDFNNEASLEVATPYALSKAALSLLFAKLNAAYGGQGILFMSICPGVVDTDATKKPEESEEDIPKMEAAFAKLSKYAGGNLHIMSPTESSKSVLGLIEGSSLEGGHGGSFRSHNGSKRWM